MAQYVIQIYCVSMDSSNVTFPILCPGYIGVNMFICPVMSTQTCEALAKIACIVLNIDCASYCQVPCMACIVITYVHMHWLTSLSYLHISTCMHNQQSISGLQNHVPIDVCDSQTQVLLAPYSLQLCQCMLITIQAWRHQVCLIVMIIHPVATHCMTNAQMNTHHTLAHCIHMPMVLGNVYCNTMHNTYQWFSINICGCVYAYIHACIHTYSHA